MPKPAGWISLLPRNHCRCDRCHVLRVTPGQIVQVDCHNPATQEDLLCDGCRERRAYEDTHVDIHLTGHLVPDFDPEVGPAYIQRVQPPTFVFPIPGSS